jgi:hypothetical protein
MLLGETRSWETHAPPRHRLPGENLLGNLLSQEFESSHGLSLFVIRNWLVIYKTHSRGHYHSSFPSFSCINGGPGDASRLPSRAEFVVQASEISLSSINEVIVDVSLFYSHFLLQDTSLQRDLSRVGQAADRFVGAIDRRFGYSPYLIATVGVFSKFGALGGKSYQE